jgi:hypothetical protein
MTGELRFESPCARKLTYTADGKKITTFRHRIASDDEVCVRCLRTWNQIERSGNKFEVIEVEEL